MMFNPSRAFREGYFAAGDPVTLMNPFHYFRLVFDTDYSDGVEYACRQVLFKVHHVPAYVVKREGSV